MSSEPKEESCITLSDHDLNYRKPAPTLVDKTVKLWFCVSDLIHARPKQFLIKTFLSFFFISFFIFLSYFFNNQDVSTKVNVNSLFQPSLSFVKVFP